MKIWIAMAVASALSLGAAPAHAQIARGVELGIDAGVAIGLGDNSQTTIDIPAQSFRAGFVMTDRISIEPKLGLRIVTGGGDTFSFYRAEVGALYHLSPRADRMRAGVYVRPFAGLVGFSAGDDDNDTDVSDTNGLLGVGVGLKVPLLSRLSSRFEANFAGNFGDNTDSQIGLLAGLSFFTR
ncbi:MAG: outer membrane beta-barrel protein [Gemmatimonadaceae bacterium]